LTSAILTNVLGAALAGATTATEATSTPTAATATPRRIFFSSIGLYPFLVGVNPAGLDWTIRQSTTTGLLMNKL
jgi:hypothetical protein